MSDRIQFRRDTAARWTQFNPFLLEGEIGVVLDNPNQYKIGDGVHYWNDLPLRGFNGNIVNEKGNSEDAVMSQKKTTEELNQNASMTAYVTCDTLGNNADKSVLITGYASYVNGGAIKVKFEHANTAASGVTLNINNLGTKALIYNGAAITDENTWADNEVVELYYDSAGNSGAGLWVGHDHSALGNLDAEGKLILHKARKKITFNNDGSITWEAIS